VICNSGENWRTFIPYIFKDETIKGDFLFTSNVLDLNEFLTDTAAEETAVIEDTAALTVFEVPVMLISNLLLPLVKYIMISSKLIKPWVSSLSGIVRYFWRI